MSQEVEPTVGEGSPAVESTAPEVPAETGTEAPAQDTGSEHPEAPPAEGTPEEGKEPTSSEASEEPELYWGETPVTVEVPDDLRSELSDKGIDVDKAVSELYAKEGEFTLSDETRAAAEAAYGKSAVSAFLSSLKAQNEAQSFRNEVTAKEQKAAEEQAVQWSNELVGGEESWDAMSEWVFSTEALTDEEVSAFNQAMQTPNRYVQELAIKDLQRRYKEANGDGDPQLVDGDSASISTVGGPMTREEYQAEIARIDGLPHSQRSEAMATADARRQAGLNKGL